MPPGGLPPTVRSLIGLTQQASVRRGPRASAPSLFTASHCSPRSPCLGALSFHSKPLFAEVAVCLGALSQQATVRRGRRASAPSLFTARPLFAEVAVPRRPLFSQQATVRRGRRALAPSFFTASHCSPRSPCLGALSTESEASAFLPNRVCVSSN